MNNLAAIAQNTLQLFSLWETESKRWSAKGVWIYQQGSCSHHDNGCHMSGWPEGWNSCQDMNCYIPRTPCCMDISCLWTKVFQCQLKNFAKYKEKTLPMMETQNCKCCTLTAKCIVPPFLGFATCMDALSGELWKCFAEDKSSVVCRVARVHHTGFTKGFHVKNVLAINKGITAESLVTELLKKKSVS